jgi:hypothetical protein
MTDRKDGTGRKPRAKNQPKGDYATGYARPPPPENGKIKPGEVRNPYGKNGKPKDEPDLFVKVMARDTRVAIDGEVTFVPTTEAYFMKVAAMALSGNIGAARILQEELARRRKAEPAPMTAEELAQREAEEAEKRALSERLVGMLQAMASAKKAGRSRLIYREGKFVPRHEDVGNPDKEDPERSE